MNDQDEGGVHYACKTEERWSSWETETLTKTTVLERRGDEFKTTGKEVNPRIREVKPKFRH